MAVLDFTLDPSTFTHNVDVARKLAAAGLRVFACGNDKKPAPGVGSWPTTATSDHAVITRMWSFNPDYLVALHLGTAHFFVIDADGRAGLWAFRAFCAARGISLKGVPTVYTPSGGAHFYFRQREGDRLGNGRGALPPKSVFCVDVRGAVGYTIAPGSIKWDDAIADAYSIEGGDPLAILNAPLLSDELRDVLLGKPSNDNISVLDEAGRAALRGHFARDFDELLDDLAEMGEHEPRVQRLRAIARLAGRHVAGPAQFDRVLAERRLFEAATACELVEDFGVQRVEEMIRAAFDEGELEPFDYGDFATHDDELKLAPEATEASGDAEGGSAAPTTEAQPGGFTEARRRIAPASDLAPLPLDRTLPRVRAYVDRMVEDWIGRASAAAQGEQNNVLNDAAHALGEAVAAGALDRGEAERSLEGAAHACGYVRRDGLAAARKTIRSGLDAQRTKPPLEDLRRQMAAEAETIARGEEQAQALLGRTRVDPASGERYDVETGEVVVIPPSWDAPDPSILRAVRREPPTFDPNWLGPELGAWAKAAARGACAPVDYVAISFLALAGSFLANRRRGVAGAAFEEPPLLWAALVGDPSAGKSPAVSAAMRLADPIEREYHASYDRQMAAFKMKEIEADAIRRKYEADTRNSIKNELPLPAVPEGMDEPHKPALQRAIVNDATTEALTRIAGRFPHGLLLCRDELASFFASFGRYSQAGGGADRGFWLEAYGGRTHTVDRAKSDEPIIIPRLSVGVVGAIQPEKVAELLRGADDGMISRFLWSWPHPTRGVPIAREKIDNAVAERVIRHLPALPYRLETVSDQGGPYLVPLDGEAVDTLDEFRAWLEDCTAGASPLMKGALGKAPGHVLRLSSILTFLQWASAGGDYFGQPQTIGADAVRTACDMMTSYFLPMAERVLGDAAVPIVETHAARLARFLAKEGKPRFNAREVGRTLNGGMRDGKVMDAACEELEDMGLIRPVQRRVGKGGRPPKAFEVNPAILAATPEE